MENPEGAQRCNKSSGLFVKTFFGFIFKLILTLACFMVYLVIIPTCLLFLIPLFVYRLVVIIAQKIFKPDWVGIMSTRDALVGLDNVTDHCECMVTILLTLKGEADMQLIHEVFQKEVINGKNSKGQLCYRKLQHYFENWLGFTFWKKEKNFRLEDHVRELDLAETTDDPNNNSDVVTEEQLLQAMGTLATKAFPVGMSPWEALIVKKYKKENPKIHCNVKPTVPLTPVNTKDEKDAEFAVVLRIHHAIGDGFSIMKLIMANLCNGTLSVVPKAPVRNISPFKKFCQYLAILYLTPYYHLLQFFFNIDRTIWHLPSNKLTKKWQFGMSEKLSFAEVKDISTKHGVCVTATLLAGVAGGIHNFLKKQGKARKNTRVMRGLSPMPWKNHPMETLVNHWTVGVFDIPVHVASPRKRMQVANKTIENLKRSPILLTNFLTVPFMLGVPKWLTDFWGTNWMTTMIISNFPGPDFPGCAFYEKYYIDDVISWVPHMRGCASLGIMFLSYNGGVRVSLSVDKAIIKNQQELDNLSFHITQEFINLRSLQPVAEIVV